MGAGRLPLLAGFGDLIIAILSIAFSPLTGLIIRTSVTYNFHFHFFS